MSLKLHIERLVVDAGLGAAGTDTHLLREAIAAELGRLLAEDGGGWAPSDSLRIQAPGVTVQRGPEALGAEVARAIHGSVRP